MTPRQRTQIHRKIRRVRISGRMAAIVGYQLGETWTEPAIAEIVITSDGFALVRHEGEIGADHFIGTAGEIDRNLRGLAEVAGLTVRQTEALIEGWQG